MTNLIFIYIINFSEKTRGVKICQKELFNLILEEEVKKWDFLQECKQILLNLEEKKDVKSYLINSHFYNKWLLLIKGDRYEKN